MVLNHDVLAFSVTGMKKEDAEHILCEKNALKQVANIRVNVKKMEQGDESAALIVVYFQRMKDFKQAMEKTSLIEKAVEMSCLPYAKSVKRLNSWKTKVYEFYFTPNLAFPVQYYLEGKPKLTSEVCQAATDNLTRKLSELGYSDCIAEVKTNYYAKEVGEQAMLKVEIFNLFPEETVRKVAIEAGFCLPEKSDKQLLSYFNASEKEILKLEVEQTYNAVFDRTANKHRYEQKNKYTLDVSVVCPKENANDGGRLNKELRNLLLSDPLRRVHSARPENVVNDNGHIIHSMHITLKFPSETSKERLAEPSTKISGYDCIARYAMQLLSSTDLSVSGVIISISGSEGNVIVTQLNSQKGAIYSLVDIPKINEYFPLKRSMDFAWATTPFRLMWNKTRKEEANNHFDNIEIVRQLKQTL